MTIPRAFIEELQSRIALAELIGRQVKLQRRGREFTGLCPFHNEKSPSFTVNEEKGFYHCFGCGAHGTAIDFVMNLQNLTFPEAVELLAGQAGMEVPRTAPRDQEQERRRQSLYEVMDEAAGWFASQLAGMAGAGARDYLERRGVDGETARQFRLGFAPDRRDALKQALSARGIPEDLLVTAGLLIVPEDGSASFDRFRDRLMFPIWDANGRVIAFGGRALGDQRAKYLNSPETPLFHKGHTLYNLPSARKAARDSGSVVVAEGYIDVIALHQGGIPHAVAPLGTALTEDQIQLLWRLAPEPVLCFDGDQAGQRAAFRAAERVLPLLKPGHSLGFALLPAGEDPDSLLRSGGREALQATISSALPLAEVLWRMALQDRRVDTPERRAGLRQDLRELVGRIGDAVVKRYYGEEIRQRLDQLFTPENRSSATGQRIGGAGWKGGGRGRRAVREARLTPHQALGTGVSSVDRMGERNLVAALLNHPGLIHEVFEDAAELHLHSPELDKILQRIIKSAVSGAPLDLDGLKANFSDGGIARTLEELTGPGTAKLDPFARPDAPFAEAIEGWTSVFRLNRLTELRQDVRDAEDRLAADMTEANFARLKSARRALDEAQGQVGSQGLFAGGLSGR